MTLTNKVSELKATADKAQRVADFWERQIKEHGEQKSEEFYKHIGLNHLESKSYEWEGLTLSRKPTEQEQLFVKAVHKSLETGKAKVYKVLKPIASGLLASAASAIIKLKPANYHTLTVTIPKTAKPELVDVLNGIYADARSQMSVEIGSVLNTTPVAVTVTDSAEISTLADTILSGVANGATSRVVSIATNAVAVGLEGEDLAARIARDTDNLSEAPIERASGGAANRSVGMGRGDEAKDENPGGGVWTYSAILDQSVCGPCEDEDGTEYDSLADSVETPNPDCLGGPMCRCFLVFIAESDSNQTSSSGDEES